MKKADTTSRLIAIALIIAGVFQIGTALWALGKFAMGLIWPN
jgi:hypothetical protein